MKKIISACVTVFLSFSLINAQDSVTELQQDSLNTESQELIISEDSNSDTLLQDIPEIELQKLTTSKDSAKESQNTDISFPLETTTVIENPQATSEAMNPEDPILTDSQILKELNPQDSLIEEKTLPEVRFITLGATAGINMTTYSGDIDATMGIGMQIGINCDIPVGQYFSIMPELIFAYKTVKTDGFSTVTTDLRRQGVIEAKDKLFYMNIPVNIKGSMRYGKGRPFVSVGPMLSIGLFGKQKIGDISYTLFQADNQPQYNIEQEDPTYKNLDFSLNFKAGYDFDFGLSLSAAFQLGFVNMLNTTDKIEKLYQKAGLDTPSIRNRTISVCVGYNF